MARRLQMLQIFSRYLHYGGEEGSVYRIADALQQLHDVEFFVASSHELLEPSLTSRLALPLKVFYNASVARRLRQYQSVGRFDLWQIHNVFPAMSPVVYQKAFEWGIPVVHYLHNYRLGCTNGFLLSRGQPCERCLHGNFWSAVLRRSWRDSVLASGGMAGVLAYTRRHLRLFERVARWIAISQSQKAKHVEMGIPAERIEVISHFYEPKGPPPPVARGGYALFVGRLSREKGVGELLQAWRLLGRTDKLLVIAGDGPELQTLKAHVTREGMRNVRFEGFVPPEQQRRLWEGAAFSVVPSIWLEPFGMVVLEAWSHARPVVAHHIGALPELIEDGKTGLLADPFQPESLASALERAFDNADDLAAMGGAGRRVLEEKYNRTQWLARISRVYEAVTG